MVAKPQTLQQYFYSQRRDKNFTLIGDDYKVN